MIYPKDINILIGCEESQVVANAFRERGFNAYSCDLKPCSGGHPEYHLQMDVFEAIKLKDWHGAIFHPVCKYLTNSGVAHLHTDVSRWPKMYQGAKFFKELLNEADIKFIAVENPIMHKYAVEIIGRRQDQIIQPWMFGHMETKATGLWLKGFPKLLAVTDLKKETFALPDNVRQRLHYLPPTANRDELRSKTYPGIGDAMADQWGKFLLDYYRVAEEHAYNTKLWTTNRRLFA